MQVEPMRSPPVKEKRESWWATKEDESAWAEFLEANKTLNSEYIMKHEPFDELSWQYFPKPKIGHRPPVFNYGFPLEDGVSDIQHLAHATGILKSEEELNGGNLGSIMVRTLKHFNAECGLSRPDLLSVVGCYSKTARFVLTLKTNYHVRQMPPEKLKHVIDVLRRYFPGKAPQWFPDTEITSMEHQDFTIPVEALKSLL